MAKTETKKTNKKTLGAVFCALSLGVACVTGLMLNDSNKKYDELKKDNAVRIEQYKTEKTALQTQLESKQAQLEELQANATSNASQIEQLQNEIKSLKNQLENVEYVNKTIDGIVIEYSTDCLCITADGYSGEFQRNTLTTTAYIEEFTSRQIQAIAINDYYWIISNDGASSTSASIFRYNTEINAEYSTLDFKIQNSNGEILVIEDSKTYKVVDWNYQFEKYTVEESASLGFSTDVVKTATLIVTLEEEVQ